MWAGSVPWLSRMGATCSRTAPRCPVMASSRCSREGRRPEEAGNGLVVELAGEPVFEQVGVVGGEVLEEVLGVPLAVFVQVLHGHVSYRGAPGVGPVVGDGEAVGLRVGDGKRCCDGGVGVGQRPVV